MKTAELEGPLLDYHVALIMGHVWRRPRDEFEGYNAWQAYEQAFGNPTPPYSTDWAVVGPLIERFELDIKRRYGVDSWSWIAECWGDNGPNVGKGEAPQEAICRSIVAKHFGQDVPDIPL